MKICEGNGGADGGGSGMGGGAGGGDDGNNNRNSSSNDDQNAARINQAVQWANLAPSRSVLKENAQNAMLWRKKIDELGG